MVDEFEKGMAQTETTISEKKYGVINHTLTFTDAEVAKPPPAKRTKQSSMWDQGYQEWIKGRVCN